MSTQQNRPASAFRTVSHFIEKNFLKKVQLLSSAFSPAALKKHFGGLERLFVSKEYIFIDCDGTILSWNQAFQKLQGYRESEILGQHLGMFYLPLERERGLPEKLLAQAAQNDRAVQRGKWVRRDGTTFSGTMVIQSVRSHTSNELLGFSAELYVMQDDVD